MGTREREENRLTDVSNDPDEGQSRYRRCTSLSLSNQLKSEREGVGNSSSTFEGTKNTSSVSEDVSREGGLKRNERGRASDENDARERVERLNRPVGSVEIRRDLESTSVRLRESRQATSEAIVGSDEERHVREALLLGGRDGGDGERVSFEGCWEK